MKTYLCIGGPLHGKHKQITAGANTLVIPHYDCAYIGVEEVPCYCGPYGGYRESRYKLTTIANREEKSAIGDDGSRATVTVDLRVDVLVHESILTFDETVAYYRKLTKQGPGVASQAVTRAISLLKL